VTTEQRVQTSMSEVERLAPRPTGMSATTPGARAFGDLIEGLYRYQLWGTMAWQDIRLRYRRSILGPFWITLSMAILVGTLGFLYGSLFGIELHEYLPFLTLGFIFWGLLAGALNEACAAFTGAESYIKQMRLPFSIHVLQLVWRNVIILAHNFLVFVAIAVIFAIWPTPVWLLALPGLAILVLNVTWSALLLGMICARFRDVPQIVDSLLRVAFFLTPILWMPELLPERALFVELNPFHHFMEVVRAPLLGQAPDLLSWIVVGSITVAGWIAAVAVFRRFRASIPYWI
jgi:ABC-type polysaccharide/polyol phosphate export permease